ncbi:glycosyltransferase [Sphingomonas sp.]|uniref:glycosyltransferase n=1 Tax=Sphingomonas sp. TaxID=28214 RepID=UPI0025D0A578|nr:glycosyltransferase [Sphingomonas sp.]
MQQRVMHIITGLDQGGAEASLFRLVQAGNAPADTHVISLTGDGVYGPLLRDAGAAVSVLGAKSAPAMAASVFKIVRLIRRFKPDVIQTWMYHADLVGGLAGRIARVPVCWGVRAGNISTVHNKRSTMMVMKASARLSGWLATRIVSPSVEAIRVHCAAGYADKFALIPNGYDFTAFQPDDSAKMATRAILGIDRRAIVVGHVGRADVLKDHPALLRAFEQVAATRPDAVLLLAGRGLEMGSPYLQSLLANYSCHDRVIALGPRTDIAAVLNAMDIFVLSSVGEAFPNVVAEAMACGVPCVVTNVGDAAEIVGDTGWVTPPSDSERLAAAISGALDLSHEVCARRGRAARERVVDRYGIDRMVNGYTAVWAEAIATGRREHSSEKKH